MMESGRSNADLEGWNAKIRKLTEEFEECDTENGELTAEIDNLTGELEERDRRISKLTSDLGECDAKIKERDRKITKLAAETRRLTALLGDRDSRLRKLTAELAKCDTTIRLFTVELGERHTKIGELTADIGDCNRKLRMHAAELEERDVKIRENEAEIRRLTELLEDRDSEVRKQDAVIRKLTTRLEEFNDQEADESSEELGESALERDELNKELGERDRKIEEITEELAERTAQIDELNTELGERDTKIDELSAEIEKRNRKIDELTAELEEYKAKMRKCIKEHSKCIFLPSANTPLAFGFKFTSLLIFFYYYCAFLGKEEEKMASVTLDPETAHPRLILSKDQKSVRWEYMLQESPDSPERFDADPCVLGCEAFTSGRHYWVVDLAEGQYCAVGVSKESLRRKGPINFNPEEGIWAVQQWGFKNRALTSPPTLLNLPRVPRKIRISLDYEWGEVAFFDVENKIPIFTFPSASFAGERIRPWFWVELGSLSLVR
ncbi:tripartite motif-containing protein 15-like isoform X12 [Falco naumanni]|uniref:tripartite motif-containing protein 15-like isoform X12 n=1 Tax=Falco naumanni TaxID=148594 RepID=UPI001ADE1737|nr:tripartite motif-containing protein 15-like isoform X12 [Falco naumanni]